MRHPLLTLAVLCGLLVPLGLHAPTAVAAAEPAAPFAASARVVVKFKADASVLRKQALALPNAAATAAQAAALHSARAAALGSRVGVSLAAGLGVAERTQVVLASGLTSQQLAARLAQDSDVEYAVVDQRRKAFAAPNDPLYSSGPAIAGSFGGPTVGQWYLRAPDPTVKSSIDIEGAWAVTTGSATIVVAVLDTGLRFDHADLQGGNVLPGYDFVSDGFVGNDGGGRDADASDPGDFVTAADVASSANTIGCTAADISPLSSWHGTQTLGLIGAATGNGIGMAGVGHGNVRVMPLRVLGKCGGFDSDIAAAMRWGAGLSVAGVPANPTPAKVISLSLGGAGACTQLYRDTVAEVNAAGAVVVASAGNSEGHPVSTPANCPGVIAVAALRHIGTKVGFSDIGPEITLSAPGGNCINTAAGSACLYPILTTSNSGATTPTAAGAGGSVYTDSFDSSLGTSFSAPLVSGTVALMLSANPALTPAEVKSKLQSTARAFPNSGGDNGEGVPQCQPPNAAVNQDQCTCTTSTCGAGMLDAAAAVGAPTARIALTPAAPVAGSTVQLDGSSSLAATGRSIAAYSWAVTAGGTLAQISGSSTAATAQLGTTGSGDVTVSLKVTDSAGISAITTSTITLSAPASSGGGGGALGVQWLAWLAAAVIAARAARPGRR